MEKKTYETEKVVTTATPTTEPSPYQQRVKHEPLAVRVKQ